MSLRKTCTSTLIELERFRAALGRVQSLHWPVDVVTHYSNNQPVTETVCCRCTDYSMDEDSGGNLYQAADRERWPCETRQATTPADGGPS